MAKTRMISTDFWSDTWVDSLDPIEKLIYIYCFSNDKSSWCWATEIPIKKIAYETGIDRDMVRKILTRFSNEWRIIYYWWYLILKNFLKHHFNWMGSPEKRSKNNQLKAIVNEMKELPKHIIIILCEMCEEAKKIVESENIDIFIENWEWLKIEQEHRPNAIVPLSFSLSLSSSFPSSFNSSKLENSNELNYEKENYQINEIANTNNITDEQYLEEANTERRIETFWEEWYENEYDYQAEEYSQDILDKAIQQMKGNLPKEKIDVKNKAKLIPNWKIKEFCKEEAKKHWFSCNSSDNQWIQHFQSNKFKELMEIWWCEDIFCMISKLIEWNTRLWQYAYDISTPQRLYSNAPKIYNSLVKNWYWESNNTSPAKARFEEFISSYPKREWTELALQWYITNVKNVELHNEILDWTKEMIKEITKSGKELTYLKAANTYLNEARRKDYLVSTMMTDDKAYKIAYDCWDSEMFRNHLKKKYWAEWATSHWLIFSELKNALMQKEWQNWADN